MSRLIIKAHAIIDNIVYRRCPKCKVLKELDDFGLRTLKRDPDNKGGDTIRIQSWCRECRGRTT